jgi:hypothetical protein
MGTWTAWVEWAVVDEEVEVDPLEALVVVVGVDSVCKCGVVIL